MTFTLRQHRLAGVPFVAANAAGGALASPRMIVLHDTAGRLDKGNSVAWFRSKPCKTSAHLVVERDGSVTQMVPFDRVAFHAGRSRWRDWVGCNSVSIGIEIVNPGALDGNGRAWFHKDEHGRPRESGFPVAALERRCTAEHGDALWMPYTDAQVTAVKQLCRALIEAYPDCNEIVTHWMISPGRKVDTNPLLPLEDIRAYALGLDDDADETQSRPPPDVLGQAPPPKTIAHSTEMQAGAGTVGGGVIALAHQVQRSAKDQISAGHSSGRMIVLGILLDPLVLTSAASVLFGVYLMAKRWGRWKREGK